MYPPDEHVRILVMLKSLMPAESYFKRHLKNLLKILFKKKIDQYILCHLFVFMQSKHLQEIFCSSSSSQIHFFQSALKKWTAKTHIGRNNCSELWMHEQHASLDVHVFNRSLHYLHWSVVIFHFMLGDIFSPVKEGEARKVIWVAPKSVCVCVDVCVSLLVWGGGEEQGHCFTTDWADMKMKAGHFKLTLFPFTNPDDEDQYIFSIQHPDKTPFLGWTDGCSHHISLIRVTS